MTKVLFVDDEAAVLESLSDTLRPYRKEWTTSFASSGREAIQCLERENYDIIVSDMRMPIMDGAELLSIVHNRWPQMTRIILSGHSDQNAILRAYPVTHQILAKPCDTEYLAKTIRDVASLRERTHSRYVQDVVGKFHVLPTLESTYIELIRLLTSNASANQISIVLAKDSVFATRILQLANSPYFGTSREVVSLTAAVNIVGHNLIRTLLMAYQASKMCREKHHRILAAIADETENISTIVKILLARDPLFEEALSVAIVCNVGKYAMLTVDPTNYTNLLGRAQEKSIPVHRLEMQEYGTTHAEVGAFLLALWGLPISMVKFVADRYSIEDVVKSPVLYALHLGQNITFSEATGEMVLPEPLEPTDEFGFFEQLTVWNRKFNGKMTA